MNAFTLSIASIKNRKFQSFLCALAIGCGIALLTSVFLLFTATENGLMKNADGVDIVVGAKGSPLQLVLSTVYHGDIPTGNIDMAEVEKIATNPQVKKAIPLAIGDNYKGFRIIGTTPEYLDLYKADVAEGKRFAGLYETVVGANTNIEVGTKFAALHGFSADSDDVHDAHLYTVVGKLKPTGTVIDKLLITSYQSVQDLHGNHADEEDEVALGHQVTALLIKVKTPVAIMNLPRELNRNESVMAVSPGHVMARLMKSSGFGRDVLAILGYTFLLLAMLMLLSVLASGLAQRRYDLAVLRVLGASAGTLSLTVMAEGIVLSAAGSVFGVVLGHIVAYVIATLVPAMQSLFLPFSLLQMVPADMLFIAAGVTCGMAASVIPCIMAARTDIAGVLAQGRT